MEDNNNLQNNFIISIHYTYCEIISLEQFSSKFSYASEVSPWLAGLEWITKEITGFKDNIVLFGKCEQLTASL